MKQKQTITRKDGIVYEREIISNEYSRKLSIRIDIETLNKIKEKADEKGINYSDLVREILKEYIRKGN